MTKLIVLALLPSIATAQSTGPYRGPIIDVHLHAHTRESLAQPLPNPATGEMSPTTAEEHLTRSLAIMKERNVVLGIVSEPLSPMSRRGTRRHRTASSRASASMIRPDSSRRRT